MAHLIPWSHHVTYKKLERIDTSAGRAYVLPNGEHVPSVTTILDRTKDKKALKEWTERVGQDEADRQKNEASFVGTQMHRALEHILNGEPFSIAPNWLAMRGYEMAFRLANRYFGSISEIHGSEVSLHYGHQYAGTTDLVATYRGKLAIVDFKQSVKPKRYEHITDYFHQLAAYAMAHDLMYNTNIDFGAVLISVQDGTTQEFTTTGREWRNFKTQWMVRLSQAQEAAAAATPSR